MWILCSDTGVRLPENTVYVDFHDPTSVEDLNVESFLSIQITT